MTISSERKEYIYQYAKEKLKRIPLDVPKEIYEEIKGHAGIQGESVNGFIKRAIAETMERDTEEPQEATGASTVTGGISLPPDTLETAQRAAEASGETSSQFISRAVETQAQDDIRVRLNEDRQEQTTAALVREIFDTGHLVTSTLWCNVAYNDKLYKKSKDAQEVSTALEECKREIVAMLDNLIRMVGRQRKRTQQKGGGRGAVPNTPGGNRTSV